MNKKILISILLTCFLPISNVLLTSEDMVEPTIDTAKAKRLQRQAEARRQREELEALETAKREARKSPEQRNFEATKATLDQQQIEDNAARQKAEPAPQRQVRLDFDKYNREDTLTTISRQQENQELETEWAEKQKLATEYRNKEKFFTRTLKALSADASTDKEIEQTRNLVRLDINRQRLQEDFAKRNQRFQDFKDAYPDFSKTEPFQSLIELNDMSKFTTMSHEDRTAAIKNIRTNLTQELTNLLDPQSDIDMDALQDLINLTRLYEPKATSNFTPTLKLEFDKITLEEKTTLKTNLLDLLTESLDLSLDAFEKYNKAMEDVKGDVKNLENIRNITNFSLTSSMIAGTAAAIAILAHNPAMFHVIHIGLEQLLITAKVGLVAGQLGEHAEAIMAKNLQNTFKTQYASILPETTALLEAETYKNDAKGIGQRAKEWLSGKISGTFVETAGNWIGSKVNTAKNWIGDQVNKVASKVVSKTNQTKNQSIEKDEDKLPVTLGDHLNKATNWVTDKVVRGAKGALKRVVSVRDGYRSLKAKVKSKLGIVDDPTNTSEFNLNKSESDPEYDKFTKRSQELIEREQQLTELLKTQTGIEQYRTEDELRAVQRKQADVQREKRQYLEDKHSTALRDKESWGTRTYKTFVTDAATDKEIEMTRNKLIHDENLKRLAEDFAIRQTRFNEFKQKSIYQNETFKTLIDLNSDMQNFVDMDIQTRTDVLQDLEDQINNFNPEDNLDIQDLHDLLQLTKLYEPKNQILSSQLLSSVSSDLTHKTSEELAKIKRSLISTLQDAMKVSMKNLQEFNAAMETIASDEAELEKVRTKTNLANGVAIVTCTAAVVCIVAKPVGAALSAIHAGVEELAIATKSGLLAGHKSEGSEKELANILQTKWTNTMANLLPETTKLLETISYESKAKGIGHRIISGVIGEDRYTRARNWITNTKEKTSKAITQAKKNAQTNLTDAVKQIKAKFSKSEPTNLSQTPASILPPTNPTAAASQS